METPRTVFEEWILDSMTSGVVAIDTRGALMVLNGGARRILGGPAGDLDTARGRDCREVFADQPSIARMLLETLNGRSALSRAEIMLEGVRGRLATTIGFTLCPIRDADGGQRGAAMIFRDLTPFERSDEQERLRERFAALGQMAAGLAHEIRNPLAGMEVLAGLLKRRLADRPDEAELVNQLIGEVRRLADTVASSLEFVRPLALAPRSVDPVELVEECLDVASRRVEFGGKVECHYARGVPTLQADPDLLKVVVVNLIVNAFESMADGAGDARLDLRVERRPAATRDLSVRVGADGVPLPAVDGPYFEVVIGVADTGPGIPEELAEKVFYPFFTTKESGSGIGLANAQKIVVCHSGSLELERGRESGCTFLVHLPVDPGVEP